MNIYYNIKKLLNTAVEIYKNLNAPVDKDKNEKEDIYKINY